VPGHEGGQPHPPGRCHDAAAAVGAAWFGKHQKFRGNKGVGIQWGLATGDCHRKMEVLMGKP